MEFKEEKKLNKKQKIKEAIKEYSFLIVALLLTITALLTMAGKINSNNIAKADTNEWRIQEEWQIGENVYVSNLTLQDLLRKKICLEYEPFFYAIGNETYTAGRNVTSDYGSSEQNYLTKINENYNINLDENSFKVNGFGNLSEALNTPLNNNINIEFNKDFLNELIQYNYNNNTYSNSLMLSFNFMSYTINNNNNQITQNVFADENICFFIPNKFFEQNLIFNVNNLIDLSIGNWYFCGINIAKGVINNSFSLSDYFHCYEYFPNSAGNINRTLSQLSNSTFFMFEEIEYNENLDYFIFKPHYVQSDVDQLGSSAPISGIYQFNNFTNYDDSGTYLKGNVKWGDLNLSNFNDLLIYSNIGNDTLSLFDFQNNLISQLNLNNYNTIYLNENYKYLITNNSLLSSVDTFRQYSNLMTFGYDYTTNEVLTDVNVNNIMLSYNVYNANDYYSNKELNETINKDLTNLIILTVLGFAIGGIISLATGGTLAPLVYGGLTGLIFGVLPVVVDTISSVFGNALYKVFDGVRKVIQVITDFIRPAIDSIIKVPERIIETITGQSPFVRSLILILICVAVFALIGYLVKVSRKRNANR